MNEHDHEDFYTKASLQIGDYVLLQLSRPLHGWLAAEGLLDNECSITNEADNFDSCIWEVHVQNQYSAAREYKEALLLSLESSDANNANNKSNPSKSADHLNQLQRAALNEQRLNDKLMSLKTGKAVAYGDPIQLRHVKSGKFLTVSSSSLAKEERENMLVHVDQEGDSMSCVGFLPRYKYDREGQAVPNSAEITVRVHERPGEYLHAASTRSDLATKGEVNCSLESTFWTVTLYQRAVDLRSNFVLAGQLVTLQDPDSLMCITLERPFGADVADAVVVMAPNLKTNTLEDGEGTNLIWTVEKTHATSGGPISVGSDELVLRDLNSGRYLRIEPSGVVAVRNRTDASPLEFHLSPKNANQHTTLIEQDSSIIICSNHVWFGQAEKNKNQVNAECVGLPNKALAIALQLTCVPHNTVGVNVHVGVQATSCLRKLLNVSRDFENGNIPVRAFSIVVKESLSILENTCSFLAMSDTSVSDEAIEIMGSSDRAAITSRQNMVREQGLVDVVLDILEFTERGVFDALQVQTVRPQRNSKSRKSGMQPTLQTITDSTDEEMHHPAPMPQKMKSGSGPADKGIPNKPGARRSAVKLSAPVSGDEKGPASASTSRNRRRSIMASENSAKATEMALTRRMSMSHGIANILDEEEEQNFLFKTNVDFSRDSSPVSQQVAQKCLKVLLCLLVNNFDTQLYVADRLPIVLNQVKDHKIAVHCVEELLKENLTVLQTKVREREIEIFVSLLARAEMSVTFLKLVQSTCSCPQGVDATQRMVTYALFGQSITELEDQYNTATSTRSTLMQSMSFKLNVTKKAVEIKPSAYSSVKSLVMKVSANRNNLTPVTWKDFSVYCPEDPLGHVLGFAELSNGLPEISVSWSMKGAKGEYSMEHLYGTKDKVPLMSVCAAARATLINRLARGGGAGIEAKSGGRRKPSMLLMQKKKLVKSSVAFGKDAGPVSSNSIKTQVSEYLNTQLFLVADLCLDRNYVAIGILENMYEYDVLVSMLKMEVGIPSKFKAAACRILRTMYVDREPHVAERFPQYIRTSVSLAEEADFYSEGDEIFKQHDQYKFALVQQIIADYINEELDPHNCDELSTEMLDLLFALVNFGFYSTTAQILEVLRPLVRVLDEHQRAPVKKASSGGEGHIFGVTKKVTLRPRKVKSNKVAVSTPAKYSLVPGDATRKSTGNTRIFDHVKEVTTFDMDKVVPWRKKFLHLTESLPWLTITILVVIGSIVLVFYQIFTNSDQFNLFLATTSFFAAEVLVRMYAYYLVYPKLRTFCYDPFNMLDIAMVIFDVVLLALDSYSNTIGAGRTARSIRIIRVLRLVRLFPVVNIITHISTEEYQAQVDSYEVPVRYQGVKPMEARTIVNVLKVLSMFYDRILDKKLDLAVRAFSQWCDEIKKKKKSDPVAVLNKMLNSEESITTELSSKFDIVLLDVVMYSDTSLTQQALQLLMVHKSHKDQFLHIAEKIQIVYSPRIEGICKNLTQMVRELKSLAEMFEIWCDLESEEDLKSAQKALETLGNVKGYLTNMNEDRTLGIRSIVLVDEEVQHILRNLDAMTAFMALLEALYDGGREELRPEIEEIMKSCCDLICWFMKSLEPNQMVAFKNIDWFMELIDAEIDSSIVVRTMLEGNQSLIKQCPRRFLNECAQKIVLSGRKPEFLDIFVGMTEFSRFAATSITGVEAEISSYLTAREWKEHVLLWCCHSDSDDYKERKKAMEKVAKKANGPVSEADLTPELKYHVRILMLLANCNLGPKIHGIYPIHDLLTAILDPATIFPVKKALSNLLIEVVKSSIDRVEKSDLFWQLLEDMALTLETLPTDYVELSRSPILRIQRGEWIEIIASLNVSFFEGYDFSLHQESREKSTRNHSPDPRVIIDRLYKAMRTLVDHHGAKLGNVLLDEMGFAVSSLGLHVDVENLEMEQNNDDGDDMNETKLRIIRLQHQRASIIYADVQQVFFRKQFSTFLRTVKEVTPDSRLEVVYFFNRIPWVKDNTDSEVRFEPVLKKLSSHFRSMIKRTVASRTLVGDSEQVVETCEWLLKSLRHLLEHEMKATFDNITDIDIYSVHHTTRLGELRRAFNSNGITYLCLDLISIGIEPSLRAEAMRLLIVMLLRNPEYSEIQQTIHTYLLETDSLLFFETTREMLENMKSWSSKENESEAMLMNQMANQGNNIPDDIIILYLLQSICEGEDCRVRDQIREQKGNAKVVNIIEAVASLVGVLSRGDSMASTYVMSVLLRTVLRLVQGPCKGNQEHFVLNSELLMALNRIIRALRPANYPLSAVWSHYLEELKEHLVDVLRGLIEGQPESSLVFDRVSSTIDVGVLHILILANKNDDSLLKKAKSPAQLRSYMKNHANVVTQLTKAQAKYLVLTQSLGRSVENYQSLSRVDNIEKNIAHVDIVWNQRVETVYFPIPAYVRELTSKELEAVVETMEDVGASREMKLAEFLERCKGVYQRLLHQELLKAYGLADLFVIKFYLVRFMFVNAFIICIMLLLYYGTTSGGQIYAPVGGHGLSSDQMTAQRMLSSGGVSAAITDTALFIDPSIDNVLDCMNIIQIICALFTVLILFIVQVPVTFASAMEKHQVFITAVYHTLMEPLPIWYCIYFAATLLAFWVNRIFITVLLLDWVVLDNTTQDVLLAIKYPYKQLIATLIIIAIVLNIFGSVVFVLYRHQVVTVSIVDMWDAFKLAISYGFRGEYGVDHEMEPALGERMVLDVVFYFVVLSILRHIFFAIIVDTFGKLRELKMERENEARNTCFICGIERHEYDRIVSPGTGLTFLQHRMVTHNTTSYIFFILNIWQQHPGEDSSLEIFVRNCLNKKDVAWMPTGILQQELLVEAAEHQQAQANNPDGAVTGMVSPRDNSGGGGGNGGGKHGGKPSKHMSMTKTSALPLEPSTTSHEGHMELMEKMNNLQKQLTKITKTLAAAPTAEFHAAPPAPFSVPESPVIFESKVIAPSRMVFSESPSSNASMVLTSHPEVLQAVETAAAAAATVEPPAAVIPVPAAVSDASQKQTDKIVDSLLRMDEGMQLVIDRLEKLERKFVKSHKYLRQRIEQRSSYNLGATYTVDETGDTTEDEQPPSTPVRFSEAPSSAAKSSKKKDKAAAPASASPMAQHLKATATVDPSAAPIMVTAAPGEMPKVTELLHPAKAPVPSPRAAPAHAPVEVMEDEEIAVASEPVDVDPLAEDAVSVGSAARQTEVTEVLQVEPMPAEGDHPAEHRPRPASAAPLHRNNLTAEEEQEEVGDEEEEELAVSGPPVGLLAGLPGSP